MNPKAIGEISEGIVLAHLIKMGFPVLIPFGNNQRYDFVIERDGRFIRLQVKTGRLREGSVLFKTCSTNGFTGKHTAYAGAIDEFVVYCPETEAIYKIPVDECGGVHASLKVGPKTSRGGGRVRWAEDFLFV